MRSPRSSHLSRSRAGLATLPFPWLTLICSQRHAAHRDLPRSPTNLSPPSAPTCEPGQELLLPRESTTATATPSRLSRYGGTQLDGDTMSPPASRSAESHSDPSAPSKPKVSHRSNSRYEELSESRQSRTRCGQAAEDNAFNRFAERHRPRPHPRRQRSTASAPCRNNLRPDRPPSLRPSL